MKVWWQQKVQEDKINHFEDFLSWTTDQASRLQTLSFIRIDDKHFSVGSLLNDDWQPIF